MPNREQTQLINRNHELAVDESRKADFAGRRGNVNRHTALLHSALEHELAAISAFDGEVIQPTHSVLHRSAARLAYLCDLPHTAIDLVEQGLAQDPQDQIYYELINLRAFASLRLADKRKAAESGRVGGSSRASTTWSADDHVRIIITDDLFAGDRHPEYPSDEIRIVDLS